MSQQGPILVVTTAEPPSFLASLDEAKLFPVIETNWADARRAVTELQPAAVLVAMPETLLPGFDQFARRIAAVRPYLPLIAVNLPGQHESIAWPENAIPFRHTEAEPDRLIARLRAALRVRTLHTTILRRQDHAEPKPDTISMIDPAQDATALLIGRGASYPSLSIALGERMGLLGALSIEAAAKHLNLRDVDGIILGEGFTARVVDAFLTVLAEDSRFRHLPVILTSHELAPAYDLPNLEIITGDAHRIAVNALPLIRQHALEVHLTRLLRSIDADGLLDPQTGLFATAAFDRDFTKAVAQTLLGGGGFSLARFVFDLSQPRAQRDGARIISRLMRKMDFGTVRDDGSVVVAFPETDLRNAHMIARRLSSVMRYTANGKHEAKSEPSVTVVTMLPSDSARSLMMRLYEFQQRAAS